MSEPAPPGRLTTRLQLRWGDTDAYGHVNNVTWLRFVEEARIRLFGFPDDLEAGASLGGAVVASALADGDTMTIVAAHRIEYARELVYTGQEMTADVWICRLGSASLDLAFEFSNTDRSETYLRAITTIVILRVSDRRPRPLTDHERRELGAHLADAPPLRG